MEALKNSNCTIIPVVSKDFSWPNPTELPEDIRALSSYNQVTYEKILGLHKYYTNTNTLVCTIQL